MGSAKECASTAVRARAICGPSSLLLAKIPTLRHSPMGARQLSLEALARFRPKHSKPVWWPKISDVSCAGYTSVDSICSEVYDSSTYDGSSCPEAKWLWRIIDWGNTRRCRWWVHQWRDSGSCGSLVEIRGAGLEKRPKDKTVGLGAKREDGRRAMSISPGRFKACSQVPASNGRKKHLWLARFASCSFPLAIVATAAPLRINVFSRMIHDETMKTVHSACLFFFSLMS